MLDFLQKSIDLIDEGLIVIDNKARIKVYNQAAYYIFVIDPRFGPGHKEGRLEEGDIVVIADNSIGEDDGNLSPADLELLGAKPRDLKKGDAFVLIGRKGAKPASAVFKKSKSRKRAFYIEKNIQNLKIKSSIDFSRKVLEIIINEKKFPFHYFYAAGNIVILDGDTLETKFYQTLGYTARKEDIKSILNGKKYISKGPAGKRPELFNKNISQYHPDSEIIRQLIDVANERGKEIRDVESIINGVPTRASIFAIKDNDEVIGAMLKVKNIKELKELIAEKNKVLNSIQILEKRLTKNPFDELIGISTKFVKAKKMAVKASESISNVLLLGESGTGKNEFARAIHEASSRKNGPFVYINCASIPENLFESELFGYEKGSFTGALPGGKEGKLQQADKGTLFLDEVTELSLALQAKLLDFLQTRRFTRVGGVEEKEVDIRLIFATNEKLDKLVEKGEFREDFYFRINVLPITLPPLRERREDIPLLARILLNKICKKIDRDEKELSPEVMDLLLEYDWKGNIRELENVLERALNICDSDIIRPSHLPEQIVNRKFSGQLVNVTGVGSLQKAVRQLEKQLIEETLKYTGGSRKKAIEILDISKTTFFERLKKYDIKSSDKRS